MFEVTHRRKLGLAKHPLQPSCDEQGFWYRAKKEKLCGVFKAFYAARRVNYVANFAIFFFS